MTSTSSHTTRPRYAAAAGAVLTAALSGCVPEVSTPAGDDPTNSTPSPPSSASSTLAPGSFAADYIDGQYSADGWYGGLPSSIGVTVTLADDVVTAVAVTPHATNPTSLELQERFAEAIPGVVIGRDIDELQIDRLAGSSGTPVGFHDALDQIKSQAAAG